MKTIIKSYGMHTQNEIEEIEKEVLEYFKDDKELYAPNDTQITDTMYRWVDYDYEDNRSNMNKKTEGQILCIASIGRWNGRVTGYKLLDDNLKSTLDFFGCDEIHIYFDGFNLKSQGYHHDGNNYYEFREVKPGVNIDKLLNKIYKNEPVSRRLLNYYTRPLSAYIKEIYGW